MFRKMIFSTITFLALLTLSGCEFLNNTGFGKVVSGKDKTSFFGAAQLKEVTYPNLTINGSAKLDNVSVTENLTVNGSAKLDNGSKIENLVVNGSLSATESTFGIMCVNGKVDLYKVIVSGLSKINGYLHVQQSTLDRIILGSKKITISDSKTKAIIVKKQKGCVEQIIELYNTKVDGDIQFEGGNGKILLKGNSEVTGQIAGGTVEKR